MNFDAIVATAVACESVQDALNVAYGYYGLTSADIPQVTVNADGSIEFIPYANGIRLKNLYQFVAGKPIEKADSSDELAELTAAIFKHFDLQYLKTVKDSMREVTIEVTAEMVGQTITMKEFVAGKPGRYGTKPTPKKKDVAPRRVLPSFK